MSKFWKIQNWQLDFQLFIIFLMFLLQKEKRKNLEERSRTFWIFSSKYFCFVMFSFRWDRKHVWKSCLEVVGSFLCGHSKEKILGKIVHWKKCYVINSFKIHYKGPKLGFWEVRVDFSSGFHNGYYLSELLSRLWLKDM